MVDEVETDAQAVAYCTETLPDIVIADWVTTGDQGPQFCAKLRSLQQGRYIYLVLLTSRTTKDDIVRGLQAGADDFLVKPVSGAELLARLSAGERILGMHDSLRHTNTQLTLALAKLRDAQASLERDLRDAQTLQQDLVRESFGQFGDTHITTLMRPAGHIGGDLVGFFPINARRFAFFALDVSGHGVASALLCARLASLLTGATNHNIALHMTDLGLYDARSPVEVVSQINQMMINDLQIDSYLTMIYGDLDFISGELRLVQAGHPHPLIQYTDGRVEQIGNGGLPVGAFADAQYEEISLTIHPGERLFFSSDGLSEAENDRGEPLGDDGLAEIIRANAFLYGDGLLESLSWSVSNYTGGIRHDDMSAVLIERRLRGVTDTRSDIL